MDRWWENCRMMRLKPTVVPGNGAGESSLGLPDPFEEALGG